MSRKPSAPIARALNTCQPSMMNSLQSSGQPTPASRMSLRFSKPPMKYLLSVSTDTHAAPPASYAAAIAAGSKSGWMRPLLGDAFFASAISAGTRPPSSTLARRAAAKSRTGGARGSAWMSRASGSRSFIFCTSPSLYHTISSRMFRGVFSSPLSVVKLGGSRGGRAAKSAPSQSRGPPRPPPRGRDVRGGARRGPSGVCRRNRSDASS